MDYAALLLFALAFAVASASPGPTNVALIARVLGRGAGGAGSFCGGLILGDLIWLACAVFGIAALAELFQPVFVILKYAGAAYLLFLAWKLWTAPAVPVGTAPPPERGGPLKAFLGALALTLGNPKTMLFYLALVPSFVSLEALTWQGVGLLSAVVVAVYSLVLTLYVVLAAQARRALKSSRAVRIVNRTSGALMAGASVAIASRS